MPFLQNWRQSKSLRRPTGQLAANKRPCLKEGEGRGQHPRRSPVSTCVHCSKSTATLSARSHFPFVKERAVCLAAARRGKRKAHPRVFPLFVFVFCRAGHGTWALCTLWQAPTTEWHRPLLGFLPVEPRAAGGDVPHLYKEGPPGRGIKYENSSALRYCPPNHQL